MKLKLEPVLVISGLIVGLEQHLCNQNFVRQRYGWKRYSKKSYMRIKGNQLIGNGLFKYSMKLYLYTYDKLMNLV
jgi:hypothetical protein